MSKRWYVVHAYSGYEKQVMRSLREQMVLKGLEDRFGDVLVPTEEVVEKKTTTSKKTTTKKTTKKVEGEKKDE